MKSKGHRSISPGTKMWKSFFDTIR